MGENHLLTPSDLSVAACSCTPFIHTGPAAAVPSELLEQTAKDYPALSTHPLVRSARHHPRVREAHGGTWHSHKGAWKAGAAVPWGSVMG